MARKTKTSDDKTFWFALLTLLGAAILGVNLGVINSQVVQYWPMILVILGLLGLSGGLGIKK